MDWSLAEKNAGLVRFTRMMIALRKKHFALSREQFVNRVSWHGLKVGDPDWTGAARTLAFQLHGWHGQPDLYVMFNAHWESAAFPLAVARRPLALEAAGGHQPAVAGRHRRGEGRRRAAAGGSLHHVAALGRDSDFLKELSAPSENTFG